MGKAAAGTGVLPSGGGRGGYGSSDRSAIFGRERVGGEDDDPERERRGWAMIQTAQR